MSALYPRECKECSGVYLDAQTYYRHRVRKLVAEIITPVPVPVSVCKVEQEATDDRLCKPEVFYQRILEQRYNGSHLATTAGVTDVTTNSMHIEIKRASNWLDAFRQLLAYNAVEEREYLRLYLFDYKSLSLTGREKMMASILKVNTTPIDVFILDNAGEERLLLDSQLYWS